MNIRQYIGIISILFTLVLFFTSCEKVIEVDLKEATPRLVIEGNISSGSGPFSVVVSTSGGYFDTEAVKPVSDAAVFISDEDGYSEQLFEKSPGIYRTDYWIGREEKTYSLEVDVEGMLYTAEEYLPGRVEIQELTVASSIFQQYVPDEEIYDVFCTFEDPGQVLNYYRFFVYINGELRQPDFRPYDVTDDELFNGLTYTYTFRRIEATSSDEIKIELQSIGPNTYEYFRTLNDALSAGIGSTPYNPIGNFTNDALGYFGSYTVSTETVVVE
jgi:hypothetical protein